MAQQDEIIDLTIEVGRLKRDRHNDLELIGKLQDETRELRRKLEGAEEVIYELLRFNPARMHLNLLALVKDTLSRIAVLERRLEGEGKDANNG